MGDIGIVMPNREPLLGVLIIVRAGVNFVDPSYGVLSRARMHSTLTCVSVVETARTRTVIFSRVLASHNEELRWPLWRSSICPELAWRYACAVSVPSQDAIAKCVVWLKQFLQGKCRRARHSWFLRLAIFKLIIRVATGLVAVLRCRLLGLAARNIGGCSKYGIGFRNLIVTGAKCSISG